MRPGSSLITLSNLSWNTSLVTFNPKGHLSHWNLPHGVLKIVSRLDCRSRVMCQYPDLALFKVIGWAFERCGKMSSNVLEYHWILLIALFKSLWSRHSLILPSGLVTGTIGSPPLYAGWLLLWYLLTSACLTMLCMQIAFQLV